MIVPVNGYVVVEKIKKEKTESGFILTNSDDSNIVCEGIVIAYDTYSFDGIECLDVNDKVIFLKHKSVTVKDCDGTEFTMIKEEDIIGIITNNEGENE